MPGNVYAVSHEGVAALKKMSSGILSAIEEIDKVSKAIKVNIDEHHDKIGPHEESIIEVVDGISALVKTSTDPASAISEMLNDVADDYNDIIGDDRIRGIAGN